MLQYTDCDGHIVSKEQISAAFEKGQAVIVHWYGDGRIGSALALDGRKFDTRGDSYSVWDAAWTAEPKSIAECLRLAKYTSTN